MDIYKKAAKKKLRIESPQGNLTVEQLFDLSIDALDQLAVQHNDNYEKSNVKTFLAEKTDKDKIAKLKFDLVLDVLQTKVAWKETATKAAETKQHNEKILELIKSKQDESLKELTVEELQAKLK